MECNRLSAENGMSQTVKSGKNFQGVTVGENVWGSEETIIKIEEVKKLHGQGVKSFYYTDMKSPQVAMNLVWYQSLWQGAQPESQEISAIRKERVTELSGMGLKAVSCKRFMV